jgi:MoaA/NifB/PqqE/SkfB family radical SAM enzyme
LDRGAAEGWENRGPVRYASVDTTSRCHLRCLHCYYYRSPLEGDELGKEEFLSRLQAWRDDAAIECMLWLGGEPFLRPDLVVDGARLFRRNGVFTNGLEPVPEGLDCGVAISLDGHGEANNLLRGKGTFQRVLEANDGGRDRLFHCTLTAANADVARPLAEFLDRQNAAGVLFGLYSPGVGEESEFVLSDSDRNAAVDDLLKLRDDMDGFVVNTPASLELMRPEATRRIARRCLYLRGEALAFDHRLRVKRPCSYGRGADCDRCGCVALFHRVAAEDGDASSAQVLSALFRRQGR